MRKRSPAFMPKSTPIRIATRASTDGTLRFAARWRDKFLQDFFRTSRTGITISSIALGTYLGDSDDETDELYAEAARLALSSGINVVDTAINYRCQRSERVIGRVLQELIGHGDLTRDEITICTKAGYIPLDGAAPADRAEYERYVRREYLEPGILRSEDIVGSGHSISATFLADQVQRSMSNLGVQGIDYFYVHNPEQQLTILDWATLRSRLRSAFQALEELTGRGVLGAYGCATWSGLRLPAGSQGHLPLYELVQTAREVAGDAHHFRVVQLPINLSMSEAVRVSTQRDPRGKLVNLLDAAAELGVDVVVSAPLLQGQLTHDLPDAVRDVFAGASDAQRALSFVRSLPAITTVAVGMRQADHVRENLGAFHWAPFT